MIVAHGVGRVYELPIPLWLYLLGAAATVLASFLLRIMARETRPLRDERPVVRGAFPRALVLLLRGGALVLLLLTVVSGLVVGERGATFATLSFWVGLIVGMTLLSALLAGAWDAADPWATTERFYRVADSEVTRRVPPWWVGPLLLYGLFWFELVAGVGYDSFWVIAVLVGYSIYSFTFRAAFGDAWATADPLTILFGFASRTAPFRLDGGSLVSRSPLYGLEEARPMPLALYASVFVLLASTTYDNLSETVGWHDFLAFLRVDEVPTFVVGTIALALLTLPFLGTFLAVIALARRWIARELPLEHTARYFGWSLVPIGIAYVLAHNAPLLLTGIPQLVRFASDPFEQGWNLLGTARLWEGFIASPALVWFAEIALIVGGHVLAVLSAHRVAMRLAPSDRAAANSQYALTVLMSVYTIVTLWLLAQPLVV